jgi:STE24 endopeptidase
MIQWNVLFAVFLIAFVFRGIVKWILSRLNIDHLNRHGGEIPEVFAGEVDEATLVRMRDYTVTGSRFSNIEDIGEDLILLLLLLAGVFVWMEVWVRSWGFPLIISAIMFWGILFLGSTLLKMPFDLYRTFVIEKKYGFSTTTVGLWFSDLVKSTLISLILLVIFLSILLAVMSWEPWTWWLWVWVVFSLFQWLLLWIYPILIAPLFNNYVPIQDETLKDRIFALMAKGGIKTKGVSQVDAGKRSRHTNAYFTGLGRTKRIVLYDTLLAAHDHEEILSILAHEIGHWKKRHVLKQIISLELFSLLILFGIFLLIEWSLLYRTFGFADAVPYAGIFLVFILLEPFLFFLTPILSIRSRKYEGEADRFACEIVGTGKYLARAMKKLAKDNLANLHPHPLYAWFYYSHPPLVQRIADLQKMGSQELIEKP